MSATTVLATEDPLLNASHHQLSSRESLWPHLPNVPRHQLSSRESL